MNLTAHPPPSRHRGPRSWTCCARSRVISVRSRTVRGRSRWPAVRGRCPSRWRSATTSSSRRAPRGSPPTCAGTPPRSAAARRWPPWRPNGSTCTRSGWGRSRAHGRPMASTRWRGCVAGWGRASACRPEPVRRPCRRLGARCGGGGSRSTLPGARAGPYNQRGRAGSARAPPPPLDGFRADVRHEAAGAPLGW